MPTKACWPLPLMVATSTSALNCGYRPMRPGGDAGAAPRPLVFTHGTPGANSTSRGLPSRLHPPRGAPRPLFFTKHHPRLGSDGQTLRAPCRQPPGTFGPSRKAPATCWYVCLMRTMEPDCSRRQNQCSFMAPGCVADSDRGPRLGWKISAGGHGGLQRVEHRQRPWSPSAPSE